MNLNMYAINAVLVLMVIRQIREHPLDLRSLAPPVLACDCPGLVPAWPGSTSYWS